jgi:hypothetical protein
VIEVELLAVVLVSISVFVGVAGALRLIPISGWVVALNFGSATFVLGTLIATR